MRRLGIVVAVAVALIVSAPMLWTSFIGDDAWYAAIDGWLAAHHATLLTAFWTELLGDDIHQARFHPLFVALMIVQFHLVHDPLPLKLAQWLAIGLNIATAALVAHELTRSARAALTTAIVATLMLQARFVYDGTTSDTLHLQLTAECGLLAVWALARALRSRAWPATYTLSVASFVAAMLFYEIMLPLAAALIVLACAAPRTLAVRAGLALPFALAASAEVLGLQAIRSTFPPPPGTAYAPHLDPSAYVHALALQLGSAAPFLYELVDPSGLFHATATYWPFVALAAIAVGAAVLGLRSGPAPRAGERAARGTTTCAFTGATLSVGPALMIAASPAFQQAIAVAVPYAPVYIQGLGFALVAGAFAPAGEFCPFQRRALAVAAAATFVVLLGSNIIVAGHFGYWKHPRTTIAEGLSHGTADWIPEVAPIFLDDAYAVNNAVMPEHMLWSNSMPFYRLWGGRTWNTQPLRLETLAAGQRAYEIRSVLNDARHGTLVAEEVQGRSGTLPPRLLRARIYERGTGARTGGSMTAVASSFAAADFTPAGGGSNWTVTVFRPHCGELSHDALVANSPSVATIAYGDGFSVAEADGNVRWRWGGRRASLEIVNDTAAATVAELSAGIGTVSANAGTVMVTSEGGRRQFAIDARAQPIRVRVRVAAGGRSPVTFSAETPNAALPGDARDLRFRLVDATLKDRSGCAARDSSRRPSPRRR